MNPVREKTLSRPVRACPEPDCRVATYLSGQGGVCPSCGGEGVPLNELTIRGVGVPRAAHGA